MRELILESSTSLPSPILPVLTVVLDLGNKLFHHLYTIIYITLASDFLECVKTAVNQMHIQCIFKIGAKNVVFLITPANLGILGFSMLKTFVLTW